MSDLFTTRKMYQEEVNERFPNDPLRGMTWYQDENGAYVWLDVHD